MTEIDPSPSLQPPLPILDPAVLDGHVDVLGAECVIDVIGKFLDSAPETAALIARAADSGNIAALAAQAHKLGSGAVTLGLPALNERLRAAEHLAKAGDATVAIAAARTIPAALEGAMTALRDVRDRLRS